MGPIPEPILERFPLAGSEAGDGSSEAPAEDLWERMRRGFALPDPDHARIDAQLAWYGRHPDYLDRIASRAEPYLYHIVTELERRGLPLELALLPIVESGFDPYAYSHGRAAGLWQFIPGTARMYGLQQDWWHDQRRDLKESTRAALDFLEDLARDFDGDWFLALAGYNAGPGNVRRALRRHQREDLPLDYFSLPLPAETRAYVPRLLALRRMIADPAAHGLELTPIANSAYFDVVDTDGQIDLAQAAALAGIDSRELYRLNPALNRWATHPDGPHRLLLPYAVAPAFREALAEVDPAERIAWHRHRIRSGESLSTIARDHGTDVTTLRRVNQLSGDGIRAGDTLLIPRPSAAAADYALSSEQRAAARNARFAAAGDRSRTEHRVRHGESLWTIARDHGVSVAEIASWNGMAPTDTLRIGRQLLLWPSTSASAQEQTAAANPCGASTCLPLVERDAEVRRVQYRVRSGDSLARIASRFGVSIGDLSEWNGLDPARYLQPGQRLQVFVPVIAGQ